MRKSGELFYEWWKDYLLQPSILKIQRMSLRGILDQLNPLVKEGHVYVKTKAPDSFNGYGTAYYEQIAVDEDGKTRPIAFNGISELKVGYYLKLTNKGAHVETYEEVAKEEVPKDALEKLE